MAVMIPNITIVTNGFFSMRPTMSSYIFWVLPNTLLKALNTKNFGSLFACRNRAHRAGVSVSELNPLKTVAAAIVRANCLYNWQLGEYRKAAENYKKAAASKTNDFSTPTFLMKNGLALEKSNDYSGALKVYEQIEQEYPASPEGRDIEKYIERAQLKLKK